MRNYFIFGTGIYPGFSAGAKRINLYIKALKLEGVNCKYLSTYNLLPKNISRYFGFIFLPFMLIYMISKNVKKNDVIIFYLRGWFSILLALFYCKLKGVKVVFEINEKPYSFYYNTFFKKILFKKINSYLFNRFVIPLFDGYIVISENLKDYIKQYKGEKAKIIKIPIIVDVKLEKDDVISTTKSISNYIIHIGGISDYKEGITDIVYAFSKIITDYNWNIHLFFTEKRAVDNEFVEINKIIDSTLLRQHFHFLDKLSETELENYISNSTMAIIFKPDNEQNRYNFSTKLAEFLKYSIPVIYTPVGEINNYLVDNFSGYKVQSGDVNGLISRIVFILENTEFSKRVGAKGREVAISSFDYHLYALPLKLFLERI